jgi:hypothetical protein
MFKYLLLLIIISIIKNEENFQEIHETNNIETIKDRFIKYVKIDTQSDPNSNTIPSTKKQISNKYYIKKRIIKNNLSRIKRNWNKNRNRRFWLRNRNFRK